MKPISIVFLMLLIPFSIYGCTDSFVEYRLKMKEVHTKFKEKRADPPVYVRLQEREESPLFKEKVNVNFPPGNTVLQSAIVFGLPFAVTVVSQDEFVDLQKPVAIQTWNATVESYLKQLEALTAYRIQLHPESRIVEVAGVMQKTWRLPALAGIGKFNARLGFESNAATESSDSNQSNTQTSHEMYTELESNDNAWDSIVTYAKCILGLGLCELEKSVENNQVLNQINAVAATNTPSLKNNAWIVENRRLGTITANGNPMQMARLDTWLSQIAKDSMRLVQLDCAIIDISLDEENINGLNLNAIIGNKFRFNFNSPSSNNNANSWTLGTLVEDGAFNLDLLIQSLAQYSSVKVKSRARLSVTNGATAYLNTGEVFSYVSGIETVATDGIATTSFDQNRLQVGFELAVTPKIIDDTGKMLVEVVPILSALLRFDKLGNSSNYVQTPVIALRQMSSQAITRSGQAIIIGSLNWEKLSSSHSGISSNTFLDGLLATKSKDFESRQLLIVITPREIKV